MNIQKKYGEGAELIWRDRKRFLGMPLSFTRYLLIRKPGAWCKLFLDVGLLTSYVDEVNMYRVCDIRFRQGLLGKILNTGTIVFLASDESKSTVVLKNVKNPYHIKDLITTLVEEERKLHNVRVTEFHDHD